MFFSKVILWASLIIVFYSYFGYGLFLWIYIAVSDSFKKKRAKVEGDSALPGVTVVIATYNEEEIIERKIQNCFELNYPAEKISFVVVADGSTDATLNILQKFSDVKVWFKPQREGKSAAINRVMPHIPTPVTVFTDANTFLNKDCIRNMVRHYNDPLVGAVAGEKKVKDIREKKSTAGAGEGLYWKYESFLKKLDARFYSVVGAAGELFSIRTDLYEQVDKNILLDDFIISMKICLKGYRVMYEPESYAEELPSASLKEEQKRKIRIAAGGFQSVLLLKPLLNIFRYGKLSFQYISHRVLRWVVCPLLLPVIFISNLFIAIDNQGIIYLVFLILQLVFYFSSFIGWLFTQRNIKLPLLYIAYYFTFMNISMYFGFIRFLKNEQSVLWEKAERMR
jgi:poly-beta-1,6-N-acetyl-D-glucosamine synthase